MLQTKKANFGIGLAANQVGILKRIIVLGDNKEIPEMTLVNPEIVKQSLETSEQEESCLSLPGIAGKVSRFTQVTVKATQIKNNKIKNVTLKAEGTLARVLQHEIDHLDGHLFTDAISDIKTIKSVPQPYKVVLFGAPQFSVPILNVLVQQNWGISAVITEPDKPAGRKQIITPPPLKLAAQKHDLLIYQPDKPSSILSSLKNLRPDLIILTAYGKILPKEILQTAKYGALCIHPSLLPQYRGASPIQTAILNGDQETGVTIFQMDEKVDHGKIIQKSKIKIENDDTYETLSKKLSVESANLLIKTLPDYLEGKIKPKNQNEKKASYTNLIKKEDGYVPNSKFQIPNSKLLKEIERKIRAFYPWPKVWTKIDSKRVIIFKAHLEKEKLVLDTVQPEGKKSMEYQEYLKGNPKII